ncbi:MAG: hypothetical protein AAGD05_06495 [Bacteroidota bacterium]
MKSFRFFFGLSLGIVLLVFLARFVLLALAMAAVLSVAFWITRSIKGWVQNRHWNRQYHYAHYDSRFDEAIPSLPVWKGDLLWEYPQARKERMANYRIIEIQ